MRLLAGGDFDAVSAAVDEVVEALVADGNRLPKWRNETFDVVPRWGDPPIFRLDRGAVPFFGVRAYGVHLNGYRRDDAGLSLWIGRRAPEQAGRRRTSSTTSSPAASATATAPPRPSPRRPRRRRGSPRA